MDEENWDDPDQVQTQTYYKQNEEKKDFFQNSRSYKPRTQWNSERNWRTGNQRKGYHLETVNNNNLIMRVEGSKIGLVIGKQGSKIKELAEKTGAKIKIGKPCENDNYLTEIILSGSKDSQEMCEKMINELVNKNHFTRTSDYPKVAAVCDNVPEIDWESVNEKAMAAEAEKWANCPPIKKNFYIEDSEVANLSVDEVEKFRKNNNNIVVKNTFGCEEKILNPVKTFAQAFKDYPEILQEIEKQGFEAPSPIQSQAWPILLSGKDLIGISQTGTGKTLAFLLPALIHTDGQEIPRSERNGANVLVIAPTRELALQIESEVKKYCYKGIKCVCIYGGGNRREQMKIVTNGIEIIIATPGRLNDLVEAGVIDVTSVTYLVLDEADRMLDMGFEPQIRKVLLDIRPDRQSVMTSATWPCNVQNLAEKYMCNPVQVYIGSLDLAAVHSVSQTILIINEEDKKDYLLDLIGNLTEDDKIIVFVGKKKMADNLSCDLSLDRILCQCIHGDRDQIDREQAIEDLKTGHVKILIATDVVSRGLDIPDITKVVNYDFPRNIEEYVHRVGRTGRAGKSGEAITFFTRHDWAFASDLIAILEEANQGVPQELYDMKKRFLNAQQKRNLERSCQRFNGNIKRNEKYSDSSWN